MANKFTITYLVISLGIAISISSPAYGQTEPPACELHIWPTNGFVVTENLGGGNLGLVGAAIDDIMKLKSPGDIEDQLSQQISDIEQNIIIKELNLSEKFRDFRIFIESSKDNPKWDFDRIKSDKPIIKTDFSCHAELAITGIQYIHQPMGTRIRTAIWYREYRGRPDPIVKIWDATAAKADNFPAKHEDDIPASAESVRAAFREDLLKFVKDKLKR